MKMYLYLALLLAPTLCALGVDLSDLSYIVSASNFQCLKNYQIQFAVIKGLSSSGEVDANAAQNLQNAKMAGIQTDVYMFPCRGKSATAQVDQMMTSISNNLYDTVWIHATTNPSTGCDWGKDYEGNCRYLIEMVDRIKSHGKEAGVFSEPAAWEVFMGGWTKCTSESSQPIWYTKRDGIPSFTGFSPFGGWTQPTIKTYQTGYYLCSTGINRIYRL